MESWYVYILECNNGSFYTGMTNDVKKRLRDHEEGNGGRYTRSFGVKKIVYKEKCESRSEALKREAQIKTWARPKKDELIKSKQNLLKQSNLRRKFMDKQEIYEKAEKALNNAFDVAKQSVKIISEKAGEAANMTKLLIDKATLEHKLSKKFSDLGSCVFKLSCDGAESVALSDEKVKEIIDQTQSLASELSATEKKIEEEKTKKQPPASESK